MTQPKDWKERWSWEMPISLYDENHVSGYESIAFEIIAEALTSQHNTTVQECIEITKAMSERPGYKEFTDGTSPILEIDDFQMKKGYLTALYEVQQSLRELLK